MNRSWVGVCLGLLFLCPANDRLAAAAPPATPAPGPGVVVVVESVKEGFAAYQAGLQPGDLLFHWQRAASPPANPEPASGAVDSPFELLEVEIEQAPRGELTVSGTRGGEPLQVRLPPGAWELRTRPRLAAAKLASYQRAEALIAAGNIDQGLSLWRQMASVFGQRGDHVEATWLLLRVAGIAGEHGDWETAEGAFDEAQREAGASGEATARSAVADSLAKSFRDRDLLEPASAAYQQALEIRQASSPASLGIANSLDGLGVMAWSRGDPVSGEGYHHRALAIRQQLAPQSLDVAKSLRGFGTIAGSRGDLASADDFFGRSLAIQEKLAPQSREVAASFNNLGTVAWYRGDLASAEEFYRRSLAIKEKLLPQSRQVGWTLTNLGNVATDRGDYRSAEDYYRRSLAISERLEPQGMHVATILNNLGTMAYRRGDLAPADDYYRRSLAIREKLAPQTTGVASILNNLGGVALDREDFAAAETYLGRAQAIQEKLGPRGIEAAGTLNHLGDVALARSDLDSAEARYQRALAIHRERAPGSVDEAASCQRLAALHRRRDQLDQALAFYDCAVEALDAQKGKLGGSDEVRSGFGIRYADIYREGIDLLVEVGKTERAFHLLERYRARELLGLLAKRDLVFSSDIPKALGDRRRTANRSYDRAFRRWMQLPDIASPEDRQTARDELEQARRRQDEIRAEIRAASPRLATLQNPQPLDLSATRAALDPGTLLLSYSIGEEKSHVFAVGPEDEELRVVPLAAGEESLQAEVERMREALGRGRFDRRPEKVLLHARRLSELLLAPLSARIGQAERLLILADGPLHSMPFAALADPGTTGGRRFLVEAKPVHRAASATVFALLKQERRERRAIRLTAFGDPLYPETTPRDEEAAPRLRAALRNGFDLTPLPATRGEVESLKRLYPQASRIYLGADATEGRAKAVGMETTHLHIASHGLLDDRSPLDSALAFSIPPRWRESEDNGLLQAWEIFEQVRLDADLVTLSACDTGLGKVLGGEGLMGLTRAFQYAGARSVLASRWSVSDETTGELMERFYGYLKQDQSKAEALRSAQLDLLRSYALSHPLRWAGFELIGGWR